MHTITTTILLPYAVEAVFDLITTAQHWPIWHPATLAVEGPVERPMQAGDHIIEYAQVGERQYDANWTVASVERNRSLLLSAKGGRVTISYAFEETTTGTRFTRTFVYDPTVFTASASNEEGLARLMQHHSELALKNLVIWLAQAKEGSD